MNNTKIIVAIGGNVPKVGQSYSSSFTKILLEVKDEEELKSYIKDAFFQINCFDYILFKWLNVLYLCQRYSDGFTKSPIEYHPLQDKVS